MAGLADLRRDTPCPAGTPTGAGATASPLRGFGHLPVIASPKPRALSGRGGRLDLGVLFSENCLAVKGRSQGPARRPQLDRRERPGEDWGEAEPLTPNRNEHASWLGVGCFTPPLPRGERPRRGACRRRFWGGFCCAVSPEGETYKCAFPIKTPGSKPRL